MAESVRTFWKGYLRLALVAIPVRLVAAEKTDATIRFHQVDRQSKQRIKYQKVAPGRGEVKKEDIATAYEFEPGNYVFMEDADLENLRIASKHTIELTQFVDADQIDPIYFERPYYVLPDGDVAEEGYNTIRDALAARRKCGIGQLTLRGKENLVALYPSVEGKGMVLDVLRYRSQIKNADEVFEAIGDAAPRADMVAMAEELIERRSENFDASKFKNHYAEALRDLVRQKMSTGETVTVENAEADTPKVVDFMEALRKSLGGAAPAPKRASGAGRAPAKSGSADGTSGGKPPSKPTTKRKRA
ncbi:DNA end-binding protein Ku [Rhodoblastus acidophilus]|uniref:non-homologous end joining protein Ku n=1 Tax=Rhodoblastus acidophilus TaxID=1074 RepID=UPI0022253EA9|nr:Ku protein [Rhodoblastus acidophilus]MCW2283209.1 DNA end-binding protein Ku [Rhodoblastus acidophilus]MCW2332069.1 DNA end-binding protein Ku [Rhodoblastus acidophilus]